jgi:hypothetical protein
LELIKIRPNFDISLFKASFGNCIFDKYYDRGRFFVSDKMAAISVRPKINSLGSFYVLPAFLKIKPDGGSKGTEICR